jgi:hypothetical protein
MLPVETAAIASILGGYLLLPSGMQVDLPMLPPIDKMAVAALSSFVLCLMKGTRFKAQQPSFFVYLFAFGFVLSPLLTSFENSYELQNAAGSIPGFYPLDGLKVAGRQLIALMPLYVGMRYLSSDDGRALLLKSFPAALLVYSLPMLFELRMSPQLHSWIYGFFPHQFAQQMRDGGFRPVVFLEHGLVVALLTSLALIAAVTGARAKWRILHVPSGLVAGYLSVLLILCKSLGPVIYAAILSPIVLFTRPRFWVKLSCAMLLLVCAYPALRTNGLIPVQFVSNAAKLVSADRSSSFDTRVRNEEMLLAKATEKPLLGWGTWGRNRVYDPETGQDISVTDGGWIIQFGIYGWFGYLSLFGLLAAAGFGALRRVGPEVSPASISLAGLTLLLAVYTVDAIPNGNTMSLTLLLAGAVATGKKVRVRRPIAQRPAARQAPLGPATAPQ